MSIKLRYLTFYIIMALGAVFLCVYVVHDFLNGALNDDLPWALALAAFFFLCGIGFRITAVRCPFCHSKLRDQGMGPEVCPTCGKSAFERPTKDEVVAEEATEEATTEETTEETE